MSGGVTGTHVVGETGWTSDDNARDNAILALQIVAANLFTAAHTLVLADVNDAVEMNATGSVTVTVPLNSAVAFPVGTVLEVVQVGAGQVTLTYSAGVTLRTPSTLTTRTQWSSVALRKRATDEWVCSGDLT